MKRYIVGISGASGAIYSSILLEQLARGGSEVHVIPSRNGRQVFRHETGVELSEKLDLILNGLQQESDIPGSVGKFILHEPDNFFAAPASGSFHCDGMAVVPCSMGTLGALASGAIYNLLGRSADVTLKERRPLVIVPRETPLNLIHLRNMVTLAEAGAVIMPPVPGFYHHPESVEQLVLQTVGRIIEQLGGGRDLVQTWGEGR
jgi:4-hydroxy-3-polyprenylbenzoate decarboxylase